MLSAVAAPLIAHFALYKSANAFDNTANIAIGSSLAINNLSRILYAWV